MCDVTAGLMMATTGLQTVLGAAQQSQQAGAQRGGYAYQAALAQDARSVIPVFVVIGLLLLAVAAFFFFTKLLHLLMRPLGYDTSQWFGFTPIFLKNGGSQRLSI